MRKQSVIRWFCLAGFAVGLTLLPLVKFDRVIATTDTNRNKELLARGYRPSLQKPGGSNPNKLTGGILFPKDATISGGSGDTFSSAQLYENKNFQVFVWDPKVGSQDGDGITSVTFRITDETGTEYEHTEMKAGYCPFGGGEPQCNASQLVSNHLYTVIISIGINPRNGQPQQSTNWNFKIQT